MSESRGAGGSRLGVRAVAPLAERTSAGGLGRGWRAEWQRAAARGSREAGAACGWRAECGGTMRAAAGPLTRRVEVMPPRLPRRAPRASLPRPGPAAATVAGAGGSCGTDAGAGPSEALRSVPRRRRTRRADTGGATAAAAARRLRRGDGGSVQYC